MVRQRKAHTEQSFFGCVLPRWLVEIALGLQVAIVLLLLALSICFTVTFKRASLQLGSITEQVDYHFGAPSIAFLLGSILLCGLIVVLAVVVSKLPKRWALIALLAYVMLMQIIWLTSLNLVSYTYQDSRSLMDAADILLKGDLGQFSESYCARGATQAECVGRSIPSAYSYFSYYPFQSGPMLWYLIVFALFGTDNILAFQIVSAVSITALVAVLWRLGSLLGLDERGHGAFVVLVSMCVPLLMFSAFVYPNAVGFFIAICGAWVIAEGLRLQKVWLSALTIVVGFLICGIGTIFKTTYQIVVLAVLVAVVFAVWNSRRIWQLPVSVVSALVMYASSKLPTVWLQARTGENFGKGLPMLSWIALGLGSPDTRPPGWWSRFSLDAFYQTGNNYALQTQISKDFIRERVMGFMESPKEGLRFFLGKLASEWSEPSFMTSLYSEIGDSARHFSGLGSFLLIGRGSEILLRYENVFQTVVYLLALVGLIGLIHSMMREKAIGDHASQIYARVLVCASFIGGFLCYLFWEAKGIYTLPFFILLLPVAAYGIQSLICFGNTIRGRFS